MKTKVLAYLQLMRLPNIFTAMADVLAGYLIILGSHIHWFDLFGLLLSTSSIYAGGCVFNDLVDRNVDARERPFRPIPSGRVSAREAVLLTGILFGIGMFGASLVGWRSLFVATLLVILVVSYDGLTKGMDVVGPLNMGACRAFNLVLGMTCAASISSAAIVFAVLSLIYVFALTTLSRFEVDGKLGQKGWVVFSGWAGVLSVVVCLRLTDYLVRDAMIFLGLLALFTGPGLLRALVKPTPSSVGMAVKFLVLGIPLLDAVYAAGIRGWPYGIPVALCAAPPIFLSRYFYVT